MNSLIQKVAALFILMLVGTLGWAQTSPPTVTSPINLCLNSTASQLTATGSNLLWESNVNSSVGNAISSNIEYASYYTSRTSITTTTSNVTLVSFDYTVPSYQSVPSVTYGIWNSSGTLIATSTSASSISVNEGNRITVQFNYLIATAGTYYLGFSSTEGGANVYQETYSTTIGSSILRITGTLNGTKRAFSNIKFTGVEGTSTAPTPSTSVAGTTTYKVTQTVNGIKSNPASIVVNVSSPTAPSLSSPLNYCQGQSVTAAQISSSTLQWKSIIRPTINTGLSSTSDFDYADANNDRSKKTTFKTYLSKVTLTSVDFYLAPYGNEGITIGLYDKDGILLTDPTSQIVTTLPNNNKKVTATFNYSIAYAGTYSIGLASGNTHFARITSSNIFPVSDLSGSASLTANTFNGLYFDNFKFIVENEALAANTVPYTNIGGSTEYYVYKVENGCTSQPSIVKVNVNGITSVTAGTACSGGTATLQATATSGYTIKWYSTAVSSTVLATAASYTTPALTTNTTYYVEASNGSCTSTRTAVTALVGAVKWTGSGSSASNTSGNWSTCSGSSVPTSTTDVTIPSTTNKPTLDANLSVKTLVLEDNAKIYLNGFKLTAESISGNGTIVGSASSKLEITGSSNQTLIFDQTTPGSTNALQELKISGSPTSVILSNALAVTGAVSISGSTILYSDGNLTLVSNATTSASIGPLSGGGSISGNVHVQAFLTGSSISNRNFRTISAPVYTVSSPSKGYKIAGFKSTMYVTGPGGETNGFDASPNNGHTIKFYNEPVKNSQVQYLYPANATTEYITQGKGIYFYFRGKKDNSAGNKFVKVSGTYGTPEDVTMDYFGIINSGNISPAITYTNNAGESSSNGFNLIGNPYPSIIDWDGGGVLKSNISPTVWVQKQNGTFAVYKPDVSTNGASRYLLPGQGFFVKATGTSPSVTFTEAAKATSATIPSRLLNVKERSTLLFSNGINEPAVITSVNTIDKFNLAIFKDEYTTDETAIVFKGGTSSTFDSEDVSYQGEGPVTLSSFTPDSKYLAINYQPEAEDKNEISLYATATESGTYSIKLSSFSGLENTSLFLKDSYTNQVVDLQAQSSYDFNIDKSLSTTFGNRFSVVMVPASVLPVKLNGFTAEKANTGAELKWSTGNEQGTASFEIQQSVDGKVFYTIGKVAALGSASDYNFVDSKPASGINYYRLKVIDLDGIYAYSDVVKLNFAISQNLVSVYPNPVVNLLKINTTSKNIKIELFDLSGKKLLEGNGAELVTSGLSRGMYIVEIKTDANTLLGTCKVIKE